MGLDSRADRMSRKTAIVFLLSYLAIVFQFHLTQQPQLPAADALGYMRLADNLTHRGVLAIDAESSKPTPFYPPLYPLLLSGIAQLDAQFASTMVCVGSKDFSVESSNCRAHYGTAIYVQLALGALTLTIIWFAGIVIFRSPAIAILALLFAWGTGRFGFYGGVFLTEIVFLPLFAGASLCLVLAVRRQSFLAYAAVGVLIGLAALTRPSGQYGLFAVAAGLIFAGFYQLWRLRVGKILIGAIVVICAYTATISPWIWRNHIEFGRPFLTEGYASFILVERIAYNEMTWREFGISFLYWLPWPGETLAKKLLSESDYRRLSFDAHDSFYVVGITKGKQALRERFANEADRMNHLLHEGIIGDFGKHTLVSVALAYRGIWIVKYWTLLAVPALLYLLYGGMFQGRDPDFLVFSLPGIFMLGLHAFVSVNVHRYNIILMPCLALASGWFVLKVWEWSQSNYRATT